MSTIFYSRPIGYNKHMDTLLKNKSIIIGLVVLLLAFLAYSMFFGADDMETEVVTSEANASLIDLASELSSINFEQSLFNTPGYKSLVDFSSTLESQPVGRDNPFGALGQN